MCNAFSLNKIASWDSFFTAVHIVIQLHVDRIPNKKRLCFVHLSASSKIGANRSARISEGKTIRSIKAHGSSRSKSCGKWQAAARVCSRRSAQVERLDSPDPHSGLTFTWYFRLTDIWPYCQCHSVSPQLRYVLLNCDLFSFFKCIYNSFLDHNKTKFLIFCMTFLLYDHYLIRNMLSKLIRQQYFWRWFI